MNKLKATLNCIKASETINNGEYFVIHSDFIIALEEEINKLTEEPKKIEKLELIYKLEQDMKLDSVIAWQKANNKMFENKITEIIDYINDKENK